jgi:hypothetical protein
MASCEETRSLQIILNALKESVAPAPFRLLVKVLKHAIVQQINFGDISTGHLKLSKYSILDTKLLVSMKCILDEARHAVYIQNKNT